MTDPRDAERPTAGRPTFAAATARGGLRASRAPRVPFAVLLGALLLGGMGLLLLLNTASAANELSRQRYAETDSSVAAQVALLRNEVADSAAPGNLAAAAAALGMVPGGNPAFLVIGADGKVTVRGSAAPASEIQVEVPKAKKKTPKPTTTAKPTGTATPTGTARPTGTAKPSATPSGSRSATASKPASPTRSARSTPSTRTSTSAHRTGGHR